ncbi:lysozyme inhibitor LprI family protein [Coralloluteibacterium thermophilus]|uniref:Lysozyme inhibitor LprI family protein n=1 Tax=Coralloluteibacterium thermophilum TaxID=2707049 RepID=A0ABV9NHD2_9GAMM
MSRLPDARWLFALVLAAWCGPASADAPDCTGPGAIADADLCMAQDFERLDRALGDAVRDLLAQMEAFAASGACSSCSAEQLDRAQRQWLRFREDDCEAVYAIAADGSGRNQARLDCLIDHTRTRTVQLDTLYRRAL